MNKAQLKMLKVSLACFLAAAIVLAYLLGVL